MKRVDKREITSSVFDPDNAVMTSSATNSPSVAVS
jgi:hypothetical protein